MLEMWSMVWMGVDETQTTGYKLALDGSPKWS
jgi:hypothetical protein